MFDRLDDLLIRYEEVMGELQEPDVANDPERFRRLMKEQSDLAPIVEAYKEYKNCKQNVEESLQLLEEESDEEMRELAKEELSGSRARIEELEKILKNAEVVVEDEVDLDKISIGCRVKILDMEYNEELDYKIVGSTEANSLKGKISNESPVGKALLGRKTGDIVEVETQAGILKYKVLEIQRSN